MELIPIHTPFIQEGGDLVAVLSAHAEIHDGDIVVISSKVIATAEGAAIHLSHLTITNEAHEAAAKTGRSPAFMQAVLDETARLNGMVTGYCCGALLTELKPEGLKAGTLLVPNAGMDESNIDEGYAIGWPTNPVASAKEIQQKLVAGIKVRVTTHDSRLGIVISDSSVHIRRRGVTAFALAVCGINPFRSEIGNRDLAGKTMHITVEAIADQLATAANMLMGNAAQSIPAVILRNHAIPFSDFCGWVDGIERDEDLFSAIL